MQTSDNMAVATPIPPSVENRVLELGLKIFADSDKHGLKLFQDGYLADKMMAWSMANPEFKVEMFRFVDVLPTLVRPDQITQHMREYFLQPGLDVPGIVKTGVKVASAMGWTEKLAAKTVRSNVITMATRFITGSKPDEAIKKLAALWNSGSCFTADILGEAAVAESEALDYQRRYIDMINHLSVAAKAWPAKAVLESSPLGPVPRVNVSVKCSSLYSQLDNLAFRTSVDAVKERLAPVLRAAMQNGAFVNLDMEQNDYRNLFLTVAEEIFTADEFKNYPHFGLVIQAYLKSAEQDLDRVIAFAKKRGAPTTVRLVKGAYWDYEVIQAEQRGWDIPVYTRKSDSDASYERCTTKLLSSYPTVLTAFGSHNVRSLSFAMAEAERLGLEKTAFEVQMLYGMADAFKKSVTALGYRVREYAPIGEILPGMAYLVRRLLENTSNESFLRMRAMSKSEANTLLKNPADAPKANNVTPLTPNRTNSPTPFINEPLRDFTLEENRNWIPSELASWRKKFPIECGPIVDGQNMEGAPISSWHNPSKTDEVITKFAMANQYHADLALKACQKAYQTWATRSAADRGKVLNRAADLIKSRLNEITALITLETGKSFREADGDIAEAIDFCRYYAAEAERLMQPKPTADLPGEANIYHYRPRGATVAIAPWNFPLAILCGMTVGPLACGNPVVMKPAEQSTGVGFWLYNILREAGVPSEALHFLPGAGEVVGEALVTHPLTHIITFTGSKAVGLTILRNAYQPLPGQKHIKKVIAELGGKNAIIVDDDADLDEAVVGALTSVTGFQGQKCSACSRLIVLESNYDKFKSRLIDALQSLKIGTAEDVSAKIGPVIDRESQERLLGLIDRNKSKIIAQVPVPAELAKSGHFVPPTVFEESDFKSELGQKEFFGPIVALFKVKTFDEAIKAFNDVDYALTGGLYSRSPAHIERAKHELEAGNLYVNRGITGALVCRQPFGGFKLSGCGGKAGGPDYLPQFLEPVTVTENTMRRGFAPEIG